MTILVLENLQDGWRRVKDNQGCAGVDGVTIEEFESGLVYELPRLQRELADGSYRPLPLLQEKRSKKCPDEEGIGGGS